MKERRKSERRKTSRRENTDRRSIYRLGILRKYPVDFIAMGKISELEDQRIDGLYLNLTPLIKKGGK
jgi:hypothetical protein